MDATSARHPRLAPLDALLLAFLAGLALVSQVREPHKQMILAAFAVLQLAESRLVQRWPRGGPVAAVTIKIVLSWLLLQHTGEIAINSVYYPIFFLPVLTAAEYFGTLATLAWTGLAAAAYLSLLPLALQQHTFTADAGRYLAVNILFFFLAGTFVNRVVLEMRRQRDLYRDTAEKLDQANRQLARAQEEARRAERLAALGQLSAGLAHEIRNPLGVIKGSAEMLQRNLPAGSELATEMAGYISSEVNRINELVARFLDFARPLELRCETQALGPLLERSLQAVLAQHPGAQVAVERDIAAGLPPLPLDSVLAESVFENLIANAFDAMGPGGGQLRLSAHPVRREQRAGVEVTVADSGSGVPTELRERIFDPFVTTKRTGIGLGLSLVAKIVDRHGGAIRLDEAPGGAVFHVFLPGADNRQ